MTTGNVSSERDILARDITTGLKIDLMVVFNSIDELARFKDWSGAGFRFDPARGLEIVTGDQPRLSLPPNLLEAFKQLPQASDLSLAERHRAYAAWLITRQPRSPIQRVAARDHYVPLTGHTSWDYEDSLQQQYSWLRPQGEGAERRIERVRLDNVAEAVSRFPAFVLLGPPGCGKSTVLERLAFTAARAFLSDESRRLPLWLTLAGYHWEREGPLAFIRERGRAERLAGDPVDLARGGQLLLLIDGLNEMPRLAQADQSSHRAGDWKRFIDDHFAEDSAYSSRAVIASRDAGDYEQRLGLPRVEIEALSEAQIEHFARAYLAEATGPFLAALARLGLETQAANPLSLYVLTQLFDPARGDLPPNRGQLFLAFADRLLRETYYRFQDERAVAAAHLALAELGYQMQLRGEGTVLPVEKLREMLPAQVRLPGEPEPLPTPPATLFQRAVRAGLLSAVDPDGRTYKFSHQLLQEQFAAQQLLVRWQQQEELTGFWRTERTTAETGQPEIGEWDPLPPPRPTGWEQTTILAAGMLGRADGWLRAVLAVNPALAGRCLTEGAPEVDAGTRAAVQEALLADLADPALHRRTRIQAGRVLSEVGDPRLAPVEVGGVKVILPELVAVPGGTATLGSNDEEAFDREQPVHQVEVAPFYLGRWPVTNAEYGCFIEVGGYDVERYWTPAGWQWRQGQADVSGPVEQIMEYYRFYSQRMDRFEALVAEGRFTPKNAEAWRNLFALSEEEALRRVSGLYPVQAHDKPNYWEDSAYNAANQPVVGVTWYEALAYCVWLNEQVGAGGQGSGVGDWPAKSGSEGVSGGLREAWAEIRAKLVTRHSSFVVRLPSEAEWEWAAGGPSHRKYPWGDEFDPDKANTLEGRILGTSPVGAYPGGAAECGALDLSGNVYEWTHSLFKDYPYQVDDGREAVEAEGKRVMRGGSWSGNQRSARVSSRTDPHPDTFDFSSSFRVVVAPV